MKDIKLSKNFRLSELAKSSTATRLQIDNWPTDKDVIASLKLTTTKILQPIRDHYKVPITPNSGYRCIALNRALKSSDKSQHIKGQAVDVEVPGVGNYELADWVLHNLSFDQLILEFYYPGSPLSGWVHISYVSEAKNRKQVLTINKYGAFIGLIT